MNKVLNKHLLAALCITPLLLGASLAQADDAAAPAAADAAPAAAAPAAAPAAPASPWTITSNVGIYSRYMFRGLSFNANQMAFQGGVDVAHSSGFFAGTYFSSLRPVANGNNNLEWDMYGGFTHDIIEGVSGTVGGIYVYYPDGKNSVDPTATNTALGFNKYSKSSSYSYLELNAALTWKGITAKANVDVTDYSGVPDSGGTYYLELAYNNTLPIWDLGYTLHVGHWDQAGDYAKDSTGASANYTDWGASINKNFKIAGTDGWNAGVGITTSNASDGYYAVAGTYANLGDTQGYVWLKRTF
jgi:uncharacterized protein (TIGR02001 family)